MKFCPQLIQRTLLSALILSGLSGVHAQQIVDNMPLPQKTGMGLSPGAVTDGTALSVNLNTGELTGMIPVLALPQRSGSKPLVLGFTYNSTQLKLRQDVSDQIQTEITSVDTTYCDAYQCYVGFASDDGSPANGSQYKPVNNITGMEIISTSTNVFDSYTYTESIIPTRAFATNNPLHINLPILRASIEYEGDGFHPTSSGLETGYPVKPLFCVTNFTFTDWDGNTHPFTYPYPATSECTSEAAGFQKGGAGNVILETESSDHSFYRLNLSNFNDFTVTDSDGMVYHFTGGACLYGGGHQLFPSAKQNDFNSNYYSTASSNECGVLDVPSSIVDKNGNTITITNGTNLLVGGGQATITDTLHRTITVTPAGFSYLDSNGAPQSITLSGTSSQSTEIPDVGPPVTSYVNGNNFPCSVVSPNGLNNPNNAYPAYVLFLGSVTGELVYTGQLRAYALTFTGSNRTLGFQFDGYNHLLKLTTPGGGYRRYDYNVPYTTSTNPRGPIDCTWGPAFVAHMYECSSSSGSCDHEDTTTYNFGNVPARESQCPFGGGGFPNGVVTAVDVTDPSGADTVHCFYPDSLGSSTEVGVYRFDSSGNEVAATTKTYGLGDYAGTFNFPSSTTESVVTSAATKSKATNTTYWTLNEPVVGLNPGNPAVTESLGPFTYYFPAPTEVDDFGYDNAPLRQTTTQYQDTTQLRASHILGEVLFTSVTDPANGPDPAAGNFAKTTYAGDVLGNITAKTVTGTNAVTQTTQYTTASVPLDAYGRPQLAQDGLNNTTQYDYSDSWYESSCAPQSDAKEYLTKVTNALNQETKYKYYSCTGLLGSVTDPNLKTTTYAYDALGRVKEIDSPDGGVAQSVYTDTAPNSVQTTKSQYPDPDMVTLTTLDGFSRPNKTQITSDAFGTDAVDTVYDSLGRVASVSTPYRSLSDPTYGLTQYFYDALDRKTKQIQSDSSSTLWWCYNGVPDVLHPNPNSNCRGNASTFAAGEWVDAEDESGNDWQHVADGLGRLRSVVEPQSLETDYTYDSFGNLWSVNQKGLSTDVPRTRSFTYTGLSQLLTAVNSETKTGTTCYGQWSGSICANGYDGDGNLVYKTDTRGIVTSYYYDHLNRLSSQTYSDGTPSNCYLYDTSSSGIGRLASEWTQIGATCPTSWSSALSTALTGRNVLTYDPMGRIWTEQECVLASCRTSGLPFAFTYTYDRAGGVTSLANGVANPGIGFTYSYDGAGRLARVDSNWHEVNYPSPLFLASQSLTIGGQQISPYGPLGLTAAQYGADSGIPNVGLLDLRSYDKRGRMITKNVYGSAVGGLQPTTVDFSMTPSAFTTVDSPQVGIHVSCNTACGGVALMIDGHDWIPAYDVDGSGNMWGGYSIWYWPTPYLTVGTHTVTANYLGNGTYAPSSKSISITVEPIGTQTAGLSLSVTPSAFTTVENAVVNGHVGCNTACGQVLFFIDGNQWVPVDTDGGGNASINTYWWLDPSIAQGSHTLTANYLGNATYAPASASTSFTINPVGTQTASVSLSASPGTTFSTSDQFLFPINVGCNSSCGMVQFFVDGNLWLIGQLDWSGSWAPAEQWTGEGPLTPGTHTVTAHFLGNSTYAPADSNTLTVAVTQ